jgi:transposase
VSEPDYALHVGIDYGDQTHQVWAMDRDRRRLLDRPTPHSGEGLAQLADDLSALAAERGVSPADVAVALELPRGTIVETLLDRGFHVYALNPKQLDRFRDRHTVAGAKDDRRDAFVLADALRTDRPAFRRVQAEDPLLVELRELSRLDDDLRDELTRLSNRLREQLHRFFPQALAVCPAANEPWLWTLLKLAPTPADAQRLSGKRIAAVLKVHRITRVTADAVRSALHTPALVVAPGTLAAARAHIDVLLPRLELAHGQRRRLHGQIDGVLKRLANEAKPGEHRDATILRSWPGVGRLVTATVFAEAGRALAERDYQTLRAHAGTAPVTRQSGKSRRVSMRHACNPRLRNAVYHWARNSVQCDPLTEGHYRRLRARGHSHGRALRGVADRLLRILIAMLTNRTTYDAARRAPTGELA